MEKDRRERIRWLEAKNSREASPKAVGIQNFFTCSLFNFNVNVIIDRSMDRNRRSPVRFLSSSSDIRVKLRVLRVESLWMVS